VPSSTDFNVKARPPATAKELNPLESDRLVHTTNPGLFVAQVVAIRSVEMPSVVGPRYCGQSPANTLTWTSHNKATAVALRRWHHWKTVRAFMRMAGIFHRHPDL
jgi:hypothetical protein